MKQHGVIFYGSLQRNKNQNVILPATKDMYIVIVLFTRK